MSDPGNATDCVVTGNLFTEPAPLISGGTNPVVMTAYSTVNCSFTGNAIGAAYAGLTVEDYNSLSTGLVQSGNVRGETLP